VKFLQPEGILLQESQQLQLQREGEGSLYMYEARMLYSAPADAAIFVKIRSMERGITPCALPSSAPIMVYV